MDGTNIPKLPKVLREALEAYADFYYVMDRGYGEQVNSATKRWLKAKTKLVAWNKRRSKKNDRPVRSLLSGIPQ